jgi:hypothetical protein
VGTRNFFVESAITIPQLEKSTSAIATPQSQFRNFLKNVAPQPQLCNFAIAIFSEVSNLRASLPQFSEYFLAVESGRFMKKKSEVKNLVQLSLYGKFLFSRETDSFKNIFG